MHIFHFSLVHFSTFCLVGWVIKLLAVSVTGIYDCLDLSVKTRLSYLPTPAMQKKHCPPPLILSSLSTQESDYGMGDPLAHKLPRLSAGRESDALTLQFLTVSNGSVLIGQFWWVANLLSCCLWAWPSLLHLHWVPARFAAKRICWREIWVKHEWSMNCWLLFALGSHRKNGVWDNCNLGITYTQTQVGLNAICWVTESSSYTPCGKCL